MKHIMIETDLDIEYRDSGRWRSYELSTHGESLAELLENATIGETDQDGGELDCYELGSASNEIQDMVDKIIVQEFTKALKEKADK